MNRAAHRKRINRALDRAIRTAEQRANMHPMHITPSVRRAAGRAEKKVDARG